MSGVAERYHNFISRFSNVREVLYFAALTIELLLMIYERTDLPLSTPSYVFRATFALWFLCLIVTGFSKRQWVVVIVSLIFTFFCYKMTGNNDLLRMAVFVLSSKDMDLDKILRYILAVSAIGYAVIFLLSVSGIYGNLILTTEYGRAAGVESRYVFGFGHPNTVHGAFFSLCILAAYVFRKAEKRKRFMLIGVLAVMNVILFYFTVSRTGLAITMFSLLCSVVGIIWNDLREKAWIYVLSAVSLLSCIALSVWAASVSHLTYEKGTIYQKMDNILTGRIMTLYYDTKKHKGSIGTWTWFGNSFSGNSFFDMGWVRVFYWYGIIPACLIIVLLLFFIYNMYQRHDLEALILFTTICIYTLVEAGFISAYLGRNYLLPMLGIYILGLITDSGVKFSMVGRK